MRVIELPKWKLIKKDVFFACLVWLFIFEKITLYMSGPRIVDKAIQMGCILIMMAILLVRKINGIPIRLDDIAVLGFLLIATSVWQDILRLDLSGIRMAVTYSLPLFMYIFIINVWYYNKKISRSVLWIPIVYGIFSSIQGIILFALNFFAIPIRQYEKYIPKQDNTYIFFDFFGGYEPWGSIFGHPLGRVRAMFVEPTKFAAFLLIPIFLLWGAYRKHKKRSILICLLIVLLGFLLTLSRAGYITFVGAIVVGIFAKMGKDKNSEGDHTKVTRRDVRKFLLMPILAILAVQLLLQGMAGLSKKYPDASFLSVGIVNEETGKAEIFRSETFDFDYIVPKFVERPWGYGLSSTPHRSDFSHDLDTNLSSAILIWPMAGGVPGLLVMLALLATMFFKYCLPVLKSDDPMENAVGLIFVAMAINSINVGNWLTCDFLFIVAIMVALRRKTLE